MQGDKVQVLHAMLAFAALALFVVMIVGLVGLALLVSVRRPAPVPDEPSPEPPAGAMVPARPLPPKPQAYYSNRR